VVIFLKKFIISEKERIDDLQIPIGDGKSLSIIQNTDYFSFGIDAVLIANFVRVKKNAAIVDLGTGCGVIPLILAAKTDLRHVTGVEIQRDVAEMAQRSVALNGSEDKVSIVWADLKTFGNSASYDIVVCNPPYKEGGGGLKNANRHRAIARHEICCTLQDVAYAAKRLLKPMGKLYLVHRPERLVDIMCFMRENGIEPKRLRFVHPSAGKAANIVLIEGTKGGRAKLLLEPPLYVRDENNNYTFEIEKIYGRI
jgi:tRNA1Val (adenine37-N6)-methyltransferase